MIWINPMFFSEIFGQKFLPILTTVQVQIIQYVHSSTPSIRSIVFWAYCYWWKFSFLHLINQGFWSCRKLIPTLKKYSTNKNLIRNMWFSTRKGMFQLQIESGIMLTGFDLIHMEVVIVQEKDKLTLIKCQA